MTTDAKLVCKLLMTPSTRFRLLWMGCIKDHCNLDNARRKFHEILNDYTTDKEQIGRIYRKSGLWEETDEQRVQTTPESSSKKNTKDV